MHTSPSLSATQSATRQVIARGAVIAAAALVMLASSRNAVAQSSASSPRPWGLRVTSGALVPTGAQRGVLANAQLTAAQFDWSVSRSLALTTTLGWARTRDLTLAENSKLDAFIADVGVETRSKAWRADRAVSFSPFAGIGAGARSYNYRKLDVDATHNVSGYISIGGELGVRRVGLRVEARDYATGFKPLVGPGTSSARNDVVIMAALRFNRRNPAATR